MTCQNVFARIYRLHKSSSTGKVYFLYYLSAGIVQETYKKVAQPIPAAIDSVVDIHMLDLFDGF
jgi:hypothetical protein